MGESKDANLDLKTDLTITRTSRKKIIVFLTLHLTPGIGVAHKALTNIYSVRYKVIKFKKKILFDVYARTDYESLIFASHSLRHPWGK